MTDRTPTIVELVGIYDADGTVLGELRYVLGRQFKGVHCSLCDITHGALRERAEWREARATLPVPFVTRHRNECSAGLREAAGTLPAVLASLDDGSTRCLVGAADLAAIGPDPEGLVEAVRRRADEAGLRWSGDPLAT